MDRRGTDLINAVLEQRYRLDAVIARGGMSTVYRGMDTRLDRPVAVKVMDPRFAADPAFTQRFVREAKAAARLQHPNIINVFDQGVDRGSGDDQVFLTMELVDGGTLRDLLAEHGELPTPLALSVLEPVLSALAEAHRAGLVHRDIKPENVLIGPGGEVKVADFGLVRAAAEATTTSDSVILGTVAYLSPEQVETGSADPRSDVYSAGIVLYEMLTGAPPFRGDTALSVAFRHVNSDVPPPSEAEPTVPPALDDLVLRATRRDPTVRPAGAEEFLADLRRVRAGLGMRAVTVPVPGSPAGMRPGPGAEPSTDRMAAMTASAGSPGPPAGPGPRGTMALSRPLALDSPVVGQRPPPVQDPYQAQRRRSRRAFVIWLVLLLVLAVAVGAGAWWLGSGRWTAVPSISGRTEPAAEQVIRDAGLVPNVVHKHDNTTSLGAIVGTDPVAGSRELRGSAVQLTISEGRPRVPAIAAGATQDAATQAVTAGDLTPQLDDSRNQYSATIPAGRVIAVSPAPGSQLTVGAPVLIVVSKGPRPVKVPDVTGLSKADAFAALTQAGLTPTDGGAEPSELYVNGQVVRSEPAAQSTASAGSAVRVITSSTIAVPNLVGQPLEQAQQIMQSLGLVADVQKLFPGDGGRVIAQSPFPGSRAKAGDHVHLTVLTVLAW